MHTYPNARLTPLGHERRRHIDQGENLTSLAALEGIKVRSTYKRLACLRSGGDAALVGRHSFPGSQRWTLDPLQLQRTVELRYER